MSNMVYVGFNRRVVALDRESGEIHWHWIARSGTGFVSLLVDGDRLIVSVNGYTYCLDPRTGEEIWFNRLAGFGVGIASIASARGFTSGAWLGAAVAQSAAAKSNS